MKQCAVIMYWHGWLKLKILAIFKHLKAHVFFFISPHVYKGHYFHRHKLSWGMHNAADFRWCTFGEKPLAEQIAQQLAQPVVYVATAQALDGEMQARIQHHQQQRPRLGAL